MSEPDTRDLLSAYMDDALDAADRDRVEAALAADPSLQAELDAMRSVDRLFGAHSSAMPAPAELAERVRASVGASASKSPAELAVSLRPYRLPWRWATPLAAAAGVLVAMGLAWQFSPGGTDSMQMANAPESSADSMLKDSVGGDADLMIFRAAPPQAPPAMDDAPGPIHEDGRMLLQAAPAPLAEEVAPMGSPVPESASMLMRAESVPALREVGEVAYGLRDGRWTPGDYADEALTLLQRDDARWLDFTLEVPRNTMRLWAEPIVVSIEGAWYEIAPLEDDSTAPGPLE